MTYIFLHFRLSQALSVSFRNRFWWANNSNANDIEGENWRENRVFYAWYLRDRYFVVDLIYKREMLEKADQILVNLLRTSRVSK